jgi:hypothetical protein
LLAKVHNRALNSPTVDAEYDFKFSWRLILKVQSTLEYIITTHSDGFHVDVLEPRWNRG